MNLLLEVCRSLPFKKLLKGGDLITNNVENVQKTGKFLEDKIKYNMKIALTFLVIGLVTLISGVGLIFIGISIYYFIKANHYRSGYS